MEEVAVQRPAVSVIIPCHNGAGFIARAVKNVLAQSYTGHVEIIVIDDASTDDLPAALAEFGDRVIYIRHDVNGGISVARNAGVERATGELLAFLDADDWWPVEFLEQMPLTNVAGTAWFYDNYTVKESAIADGGTPMTPTEESLVGEWLNRGPTMVDRENLDTLLTIPSLFKVIVHRDDFTKAKGFDRRYQIEDLHFYIKLAAAGVRLSVIKQPKGFYLVRSSSVLRSIASDDQKKLVCLQNMWMMFGDLALEQPLPPAADIECRRLRDYYRARYADMMVKSNIRGRRFGALIKPEFLRHALPAVPGIVLFKVRGLASRMRSIKKSVIQRDTIRSMEIQ